MPPIYAAYIILSVFYTLSQLPDQHLSYMRIQLCLNNLKKQSQH